MTKPDWPSIKRDYVETTLTLAEVQAKWGVRRGTLSARATRETWHDQKQQYAAKVEQTRREKNIAKTAEDQAKFQSNVIKVVNAQLGMIAHQMQEKGVDIPKLLKLTNALANVQRIGFTALGIGPGRAATAPDDAMMRTAQELRSSSLCAQTQVGSPRSERFENPPERTVK